jgi:hypothetical protein
VESSKDRAAILEPFKAFVTKISFPHSPAYLNCRIKSDRGSIPRQSFDEFFTKRIMTPALIEDINRRAGPNGGDTGSGIQDDPELMQNSQLPVTPRAPAARVGLFVQNVPMTEIIDSYLGVLRPRSQLSIL